MNTKFGRELEFGFATKASSQRLTRAHARSAFVCILLSATPFGEVESWTVNSHIAVPLLWAVFFAIF